MTKMLLEPKDIQRIMDRAFEDVERDLYYAIKNVPEDRASLLNQLDVISKAKERIDARLDYSNPTA